MDKSMVIMIGIQGSGKSEYVKRFLSEDYVHVSLDILHTRKKERLLIEECLSSGKSFVVDNTNPTQEERARYIPEAKEHGYRVIGIFVQSVLKDCIERNSRREGKTCVPVNAIACTSNRLEMSDYSEGFDELYFVHNEGDVMWKEEWRT